MLFTGKTCAHRCRDDKISSALYGGQANVVVFRRKATAQDNAKKEEKNEEDENKIKIKMSWINPPGRDRYRQGVAYRQFNNEIFEKKYFRAKAGPIVVGRQESGIGYHHLYIYIYEFNRYICA